MKSILCASIKRSVRQSGDERSRLGRGRFLVGVCRARPLRSAKGATMRGVWAFQRSPYGVTNCSVEKPSVGVLGRMRMTGWNHEARGSRDRRDHRHGMRLFPLRHSY
jgi:hypothetical protein